MIGVFDSGVGGLTVLRELRAAMPRADLLYFGDTKHAPYGARPHYELVHLTVAAMNLLQSRGATSFLSACNSVSVTIALAQAGTFSFPPKQVIEMVGPAVDALAPMSRRILLAATQATVDSYIYQDAFAARGRDIEAVAVPELAGAIERGAGAAELESVIRSALSPHAGQYDTLLLGCTHYPLVADAFSRVAGESVEVFDPAAAVAARAAVQFSSESDGAGTTRFLVSADTPVFRQLVAQLFAADAAAIEVVE